jgi:hypothetical protein
MGLLLYTGNERILLLVNHYGSLAGGGGRGRLQGYMVFTRNKDGSSTMNRDVFFIRNRDGISVRNWDGSLS